MVYKGDAVSRSHLGQEPGFFCFMFILVTASTIAAGFALDTVAIGDTGYCVDNKMLPYGASGVIIIAVNDTLIFISITIKLFLNNKGLASCASSWKMFLTGEGMGQMSQILLRSGQQFYLYVLIVSLIRP